MDRGKKPSTLFTKNSKIYMDMKDIIREHALPFLPAKSLRRCRGVCRDWKSTISSPFFAHTQSNTFNGVSGVFCQSASGVPSFVSLDPIAYGVPDPSLNFLPEPVDIRASSNGLVCCQGRTGNKAYYICNPVTKQWKKLPLPEADHGADPALVLVFEPSLLNFTAEYKLVCAFPSELDGIEFEIYSSEKGSWRISGDICFGDAKLFPTSGVYVNGTVYWLGTHGIISLDLATERSKILSCGLGTLGVMNKKLCTAYLRGSQKLDVFVLSNTYSNTMQMHSRAKTWIAVKPNINPNLPATLAPRGAYYTGECNYYSAQRSEVRDGVVFVRENLVLMRYENTLYSHDLKKETTATLGEVESRARIFGYVNSLVEL